MERFVLIARLKPEGRDHALELIAQHQAGEYVSTDFERQAIFLAEGEVIFSWKATMPSRRCATSSTTQCARM